MLKIKPVLIILILTMYSINLLAENESKFLGIVYDTNYYLEDEKRQNYFVGKKNMILYAHAAERIYVKLFNVVLVDKFIFAVNIKPTSTELTAERATYSKGEEIYLYNDDNNDEFTLALIKKGFFIFASHYDVVFDKESGKLKHFDKEITLLKEEDIGKKFITKGFNANADEQSMSQELIYSGNSGDIVFFKYREYYKIKYVRDSYTQDLRFDLRKGNTIRIKNVTIKIHEITNENLKYEILYTK